MRNKPLFTGMPGGIDQIEGIDVKNLLGRSGLNTGNFLFVNALRKILGKPNDIYKPINYFNDNLDNYDYIAIAAANWVNPDANLAYLADFLETTKLPCVVVGLGGQVPFGGKLPKLQEGTERFLKIVSERSHSISVRGQHTQDILEQYGIHNTWVTGCPSILGDGLGIRPINNNKAISDIKKVVIQGTRHSYSESIFKKTKINDINLQIYRLALEKEMPLLLQSEVADIYITMEENCDYDLNQKNMIFLKQVYQKDESTIINFLKNNALLYWNLTDWFEDLSHYDFLIGTRIHGVMSALLSGVPAVLLTHDERTKELAEVMNIPYQDIRELESFDENVIFDIIKNTNFEKFNNGRDQYTQNFKDFFNENNIKTIIKN